MPYSFHTFNGQVRGYVLRHFPDHLTPILDVGAGAGKYARLLPEYENLDALEVFAPYVERFDLEGLYRDVLIGDIQVLAPQLQPGQYHLAILGDVLEHLGILAAQAVLKALRAVHCQVIVVVPFLFTQEECEGNLFERHLQPDLTRDIMKVRYPELQLLVADNLSGVYVGK